jgi:hypothetical protein
MYWNFVAIDGVIKNQFKTTEGGSELKDNAEIKLARCSYQVSWKSVVWLIKYTEEGERVQHTAAQNDASKEQRKV